MYGWADWSACDRLLDAAPFGGLFAFDGGAPCAWRALTNAVSGPAPRVLAPPVLPSGAHGEQVFPAAGSGGGMTLPTDPNDAQAVVDEIANQQLRDQQALNREAVRTGGSWVWDVEAGAANAGDAAGAAAAAAFNWLPWALGGLGVFALVALSAGGPRRYGR